MRLHQEEERSRNWSKRYLALRIVCIKLYEKSHTGRVDQALSLAQQSLAVEEQHSYRLIHDYQQREDVLLRLIPRMIGPQMIASYNWKKIIQDNAARKVTIRELESDIKGQRESYKDRVKEQNAEIEDLNQEITHLRAQISTTKNPRKRALPSETEQTNPRIEFVHCFPGQMRCLFKGRWKKLRKV